MDRLSRDPKGDRARLADRIAASGAWEGVGSDLCRTYWQRIVDGELPVLVGTDWMPVDADEIAEGNGIETLLQTIRPALARRGFDLDGAEMIMPDGARAVRVNGETVQVVAPDDTFDDPYVCTVVPLGVVNRKLKEAGSPARVLVLYTGTNDSVVVVGPYIIAQLMVESSLFKGNDIPVVPG